MARTNLFRALMRSIGLQMQAQRKNISAAELFDRMETARRFSRREFLGTTIGAAGFLSLAPLEQIAWSAAKKGSADIGAHDPVIILGAGFAGLTAAYRLQRARVPFMLFEASTRLGGRVFTKNNFNKDGMFCELGAELVDNTHESLINLAGELSVAIEDFGSFDEKVEKAAYEFQGNFYSEKDLIQQVKPLCTAILRDLKAIFPEGKRQPVTYKNTFNAKKFDDLTLEQYLDAVSDLPKWVKETVKHSFTSEYGLETGKQSSLNLLLLIGTDFEGKFDMFGEGAEMKRIKGGGSRLEEALAKRIGIKAGKDSGKVKFGHSLVSWKEKNGNQLLTFAASGRSMHKEVKASQVICTIPFSRLREVSGISGLGFSERKLKAIMRLPYGTNSKLMLGFRGRPWRNPPVKGTVSPTNGSLFSDPLQSLWETSRIQRGKSGILTNFVGGEMGLKSSLQEITPILESVERFYEGARTQFDSNSALMNWNHSPHHKGSYACTGPGNYTDFFGAIGEEELGGRVVFAGEHASVEYQAYMNGAIETGEMAAAKVIASRQNVRPARR